MTARKWSRCDCGRRMKPGAAACFYCRYRANGWKTYRTKTERAKPAALKHVSTSVYVQHDPIRARYEWMIAAGR